MTQEEALSRLAEYGAVNAYDDRVQSVLEDLVKEGLAVRCDNINHNGRMLNPAYIYVSNDDRGRALAIKYPLFTAFSGYAVFATRSAYDIGG